MPESTETARHALMGMASLMKQAFYGQDLNPLAEALLQRARANPQDAEALMDLATIRQLQFRPEEALPYQAEALAIQREYQLLPSGPIGIRLLALMIPGVLADNTPLEFLVEGSDIALTMLYLDPDAPLPSSFPDHDVMFVAIGEGDHARPLLHQLEALIPTWPHPVFNLPASILKTSREGTYANLKDQPGIVIPPTVRADRSTLERLASDEFPLSTLLEAGSFPIIIRPIASHAGKGLLKLENRSDLANYLHQMPDPEFYVSPFVDYRGADGQFRKARVALVQGRPFAVHLGISNHWMIHYLNAGMDQDVLKRAEEAVFMSKFDERFGHRHEAAWRIITERLGIDYLLIDCGETPQGELLIFEVDNSAVVHAMDPVAIFPYKKPQMHKVFAAFREMLDRDPLSTDSH